MIEFPLHKYIALAANSSQTMRDADVTKIMEVVAPAMRLLIEQRTGAWDEDLARAVYLRGTGSQKIKFKIQTVTDVTAMSIVGSYGDPEEVIQPSEFEFVESERAVFYKTGIWPYPRTGATYQRGDRNIKATVNSGFEDIDDMDAKRPGWSYFWCELVALKAGMRLAAQADADTQSVHPLSVDTYLELRFPFIRR